MPENTLSQSRTGTSVLLAILALSTILNAVPLWWGLPSSAVHTWAFDEIPPSARGLTVESRHMGRYPPLHYYVLGTLYSPVRFLAEQGWLPLSARELRTTLQVLGRTLSLLMATGTVFIVYLTGCLVMSRAAARLAALLVAVTLPFVFYAKTINLESPYLFWFALSILFLLRAMRRQELLDYLLLGATVAFAICTKDQAFALYLGLPVLLAASLHARLFATGPTPRTVTRVLLDRRIVLCAAVSLGLFALIHNLIFDFQGFLLHLRIMTGPGSEPSRVFEHSIRGHLAMLTLAGRHLLFAMGWPAIVAAGAGIVIAARRYRQYTHLLLLLVPVATYYLFFIVVILYHRVRFFLPVCVVLALFTALALTELGKTSRVRRPFAALAVAAVVLLPLLRAVSLDLSMLGDSRYFVESWVSENLRPGERALAVGNHEQRLPRGFGTVPWGQLVAEGMDLLRRRDAAFLLYNPAEVISDREVDMERSLLDGSLNYELAFRHRHRPWLDLIDTSNVSTNLTTVNPEIAVLRRIGDWGMSDEEMVLALVRLEKSFEPKLWNAVLETIRRSPFLGLRSRAGDGLAFGLHFNSWTRGTTPAAIVVENQGDSRIFPSLRLTSAIPDSGLPQTVRVIAGRRDFERVFPRRGSRDVKLPSVAGGKSRMFVVVTDREWQQPQTGQRLGIHVQLRTTHGGWTTRQPDREAPPANLRHQMEQSGQESPVE